MEKNIHVVFKISKSVIGIPKLIKQISKIGF